MVPLLILNAFLWYGIGYRFLVLKRGSRDPLVTLIGRLSVDRSYRPRGIVDGAVFKAVRIFERHRDNLDMRLDELLFGYQIEIKKFRGLVNIIVLVAPLIGLLGTVDGMIEMFQSLVDGRLFSQGGGIAAGVAKALCTTELGLVIAVPGIIIHNNLNNRGKRLEEELDQVKFLMLSKFNEITGNYKVAAVSGEDKG